jgi:uncharacterized protein (TIGR01777 family)
MTTYFTSSRLPVSAEAAFAWHERPGAFERLTPPWERVQMLHRDGTIHDGDRSIFKNGGFRWEARHFGYRAGREFRDEQVRGPFAYWVHQHRFEPQVGGSRMEDFIDYRLPLGVIGEALAGGSIRRRLERLFRYRHRVLAADLGRHQQLAGKLRIAVSGASGLIGSALVPFLTTGGHQVLPLVRRPAGPGEISWDPARGTIDRAALEGVDAVVHLAGENVGGGRWTQARKGEILRSRVEGTRLLSEAIASLSKKPRVFVSASAIGYYGDGGPFDEAGAASKDFLGRVCAEWEAAADPARNAGVRVVHPRLGVVLSPKGGALGKLLTPFSLGAGGPVGSGRQMMSWVAIDDALFALHQCLFDDALDGGVNVTAPNPVSNSAFAASLGRVLRRPAFLPLPAAAVRLLFGEMGETVLLGGATVMPRRLVNRGFEFQFPELETALAHLLGREPTPPLLEAKAVSP